MKRAKPRPRAARL